MQREQLHEWGLVTFTRIFWGFCLEKGGEPWFQSSRRPNCIWGRCLAHTFSSQTPAPPPPLPPATSPAGLVQAEHPHHPPASPRSHSTILGKRRRVVARVEGETAAECLPAKDKLLIFHQLLFLTLKKNMLIQHLCSTRDVCVCAHVCASVLV